MFIQFVRAAHRIWSTENPNRHAAALAYRSMFSFVPIIYIAVSIVGLFADTAELGNEIYLRLSSVLGEDVAVEIGEYIVRLGDASSGRSMLVWFISLLALLFAATGVFQELQSALNAVWRVPPPSKGRTLSFIKQRLISVVMVIGVGLLGTAAVLANLVLAWSGSMLERALGIDAHLSVAAGILALVMVVITFAVLYKSLPATAVAWGDVWLGAVIAALLVKGATSLAGLYFRNSSLNSALQIAGAFSVLLLCFYYFAEIFLIGAILCRVYADLLGSRRSLPEHE